MVVKNDIMKKIKIYSTILLITSCLSCNKDNSDVTNDNLYNNEVQFVEFDRYKLVDLSKMGVYANDFQINQGVTIRNKKTSRRYLDKEKSSFMSYVLGDEKHSLAEVDFNQNGFEKYDLKNNILVPEGFMKNKFDIVNKLSKSIYGKKNIVSFKSSSFTIKEEIYVPKIIKTDMISNFNSELNCYEAFKDNFIINYNVDPLNKNGVAVLLLTDGITSDMSLDDLRNTPNSIDRKILIFDPVDDGSIQIPSNALQGIPNNSFVTAIVMRNNNLLKDNGDNRVYYVSGSEFYERFLLTN